MNKRAPGVLTLIFLFWSAAGAAGQSGNPILLWPRGAPGGSAPHGPEHDTTQPSSPRVAGRRVIRLTDVSKPTLTIYKPRNHASRAAVVVFPGGAYRILAMDLEGTEICRWLNSMGVTAALVKYRVPSPPGLPPYTRPLQDAQRAVGLVRYHAKEWGIDPARIGVIGFSAGGDVAALLSNHFNQRTYPPAGPADAISCRPDFAILIYPAYLVDARNLNELAPELQVTRSTPPTFLTQTEDDPVHVENSIYYFLALKRAGVPAEMHIYPAGGHGYGLRRTKEGVTTWPARAESWMRSLGIIGPSGSH